MSVKVFVKIGDDMLPLEECEWVWFQACGCAFACSHAETADEEAAWKGMFEYADDRKRHRKNGVTAELISKERFRSEIIPMMRSDYSCPHWK